VPESRTASSRHAPAAASCHAAWPLPRHEKSEIHKEIEALEQQWQQATVTNNIGEMNRLLADDYVGISSNGLVENKQQALGSGARGRCASPGST